MILTLIITTSIMRSHQSLLMFFFLVQINHCSAMEIEVRPVAVLAFTAGVYALYENTESDRQLRRPFNAGILSSLIVAGVMKAIEEGARVYLQTDMFGLTPLAQALKIATAAVTEVDPKPWTVLGGSLSYKKLLPT